MGSSPSRRGQGPDGVPQVAGHPWDSEHAARIIHDRAGPDAHLVANTTPARFDVLGLLVATDGAVARFGHDVRRLRPNLVLGGVDPDLESQLPGSALVIGEALIGVHSVRDRCIVTTIDPDTGQQDLEVLRSIRRTFNGQFALDCWVIRPGMIRVGEPVDIVPAP
jgi:hypothetical protein